MKMSAEEQEKFYKAMRTCQCCNKEVDSIFQMRWLRGIKKSKACSDCAEEYFETVKEQYFVEEYKGNKFYKDGDKYFPYWEAQYYFDSVEGCRVRTDDTNIAVVNMESFHSINGMLK